MSFVNGKYVADEELFTQAVSFERSAFFPNIVQDEFESKILRSKKQFDCLYEKYC